AVGDERGDAGTRLGVTSFAHFAHFAVSSWRRPRRRSYRKAARSSRSLFETISEERRADLHAVRDRPEFRHALAPRVGDGHFRHTEACASAPREELGLHLEVRGREPEGPDGLAAERPHAGAD